MADETFDNEVNEEFDIADVVDSKFDEPAPEPEPAPAPAPEPAPAAKVAKAVKKVAAKRAPSPAGAAVSGNEHDTVSLAACVFKNKMQKKSLSVHHVQRRLAELGYPDAYTDKDGWYGDLTMQAVRQYQEAEGIDGDGVINIETLRSLFDDDRNVIVAE